MAEVSPPKTRRTTLVKSAEAAVLRRRRVTGDGWLRSAGTSRARMLRAENLP